MGGALAPEGAGTKGAESGLLLQSGPSMSGYPEPSPASPEGTGNMGENVKCLPLVGPGCDNRNTHGWGGRTSHSANSARC